MEHNQFQHPVRVLVGLGFPTDIQSVQDAFVLLDEWPPSKRHAAHGIALNACSAALAGEVDAETARGIVAAKAIGTFGLASGDRYDFGTEKTGMSDFPSQRDFA